MFQKGKLGTTAVGSHGDDCEATLGGSQHYDCEAAPLLALFLHDRQTLA